MLSTPLLTLLTLFACRSPELVDLPCDPEAPPSSPDTPALVFDGERPKNLLMISMDTFRKDRVGRYGPGPVGDLDTDFFDRLLSEGVALDDHRSCSNWTYPGMLCALTGQGPLELDFIAMTNTGSEPPSVPGRIDFIGDWMGEAGFSTHLITANGLIGKKFDFARAYQEVREVASQPADTVNSYATDLLYDLREQEQPWFVHLHYIDPHITYAPPDEYLEGLADLPPLEEAVYIKSALLEIDDKLGRYSEEEVDLIKQHLRVYYDGEIAWLDDSVEALFETLAAYGLDEDTLVVMYTDHGEQFWDHGQVLHHKGVYQEETDALALFWSPGLKPTAWSAPTTHADLVPTIFEALALQPPPEVSGAVVGTEPEVCARFAHAIDEETGTQSVDYGDLRMVYHWNGDLELYDRAADPAEANDLYERGSEAVQLLWSFLSPKVDELDALHPNDKPRQPRI